jgi:hypothetical protein
MHRSIQHGCTSLSSESKDFGLEVAAENPH